MIQGEIKGHFEKYVTSAMSNSSAARLASSADLHLS
jgi:hypothetical protein